jgi:hypothetical protein
LTTTKPHEPKFTVRLYRGTNDLEPMVAFLQTLGMGPVADHQDDDDLVYISGKGGVIALYENPERGRPGRAELAFQTNDRDAAEKLLSSYDVHVDRPQEARQPGVTALDVNGQSIWIVESPIEFDHTDEPTIEVVALRHTPKVFSDTEFFELLGFTRQWEGDAAWRLLAGEEPVGVIGLTPGNVQGCEPGQATVQLGFTTTEPLGRLSARLEAKGYHVSGVIDANTPFLSVTDPDGITSAVFGSII